MTTNQWNHLTPALFAIAETRNADLGVACDMLRNNLRQGRDVDGDTTILPEEYRPDYAASVKEDLTSKAEFALFRVFEAKVSAYYGELCRLWEARDYEGMVALMAEDPEGVEARVLAEFLEQ